jgi:hypothetical protein
LREALDNPGVDPRLTSKSLAASRMLRVLVEVFQGFLELRAEPRNNLRKRVSIKYLRLRDFGGTSFFSVDLFERACMVNLIKGTSKNIGSPWRCRLRLMSQPMPALAGSRAGAIFRGALNSSKFE